VAMTVRFATLIPEFAVLPCEWKHASTLVLHNRFITQMVRSRVRFGICRRVQFRSSYARPEKERCLADDSRQCGTKE
jgi:hypothetical protein